MASRLFSQKVGNVRHKHGLIFYCYEEAIRTLQSRASRDDFLRLLEPSFLIVIFFPRGLFDWESMLELIKT